MSALAPTKPFTKWVGGKRQLLPVLKQLMPNDYRRYYEPFIGGGAMLFALQPKPAVINDYNQQLINAYRMIQTQLEAVLASLQHHADHNSKEYYLSVRRMDRDGRFEQLSAAEQAARLIYMLRVDYNGLYRVNRHNQFNVPYGRNKNPKIVDADNLGAVSAYLQQADIEIRQGDFEQAVVDAEAGDFVYFDPPYIPLTATASFTAYTDGGFGADAQQRLADLFKTLAARGVRCMLSNSDTPMTRALYADFTIHTVSATRAINSKAAGRGAINEVVVTSY